MSENPQVLFVEVASRRPLPSAHALDVACKGARRIMTTGVEQAKQVLSSRSDSPTIAVVSNLADASFFEFVRLKHPKAVTILATSQTIHHYSLELEGKDSALLDHVVAQTTEEWMVHDLRVTLQKILQHNYFGIEKYLHSATPVFEHIIKTSKDRDQLNQSVQKWSESCGLGKNIGRLVFGITEELLMNAIYDAPVAGGRTKYESMERTSHRELEDDECSTLRYGFDSRVLALSIIDPFGAFKRDKWWQYTRKILKRDDADGLIDSKKGGAGLGIFKMLYSSHGIVCNVDPGKQTEVIVLIDTTHAVRDFATMPRSIHYFCATNS